jgi:hypothetical protein
MTQRQIIEAVYLVFRAYWSDPQRIVGVWTPAYGRRAHGTQEQGRQEGVLTA